MARRRIRSGRLGMSGALLGRTRFPIFSVRMLLDHIVISIWVGLCSQHHRIVDELRRHGKLRRSFISVSRCSRPRSFLRLRVQRRRG
eukprot:7277505-Pyramimonas_sp.AAC.1